MEGFEDDALLGRVRAGGDDERTVSVDAETLAQLFGERLRGRRFGVELDVAGDARAFGGEAECDKPLGVGLSLHGREREFREDAPDEGAYELVTAERLLGDAAVDERERHTAPPALAEEARPQLRLHQEDDGRIDGPQRAAPAPSPVEGEREDERGLTLDRLARAPLPGQRRR